MVNYMNEKNWAGTKAQTNKQSVAHFEMNCSQHDKTNSR